LIEPFAGLLAVHCPFVVQLCANQRLELPGLLALLALVQMAVRLVEERAAVAALETLSRRGGIHPRKRHQRRRRMAKEMERESVEDGRPVVALVGIVVRCGLD
jgi:hypothetical protein